MKQSYLEKTKKLYEVGELTYADAFGLASRLDELSDKLTDNKAIQAVIAERRRQDEKWGEQSHYFPYWMGILGEEFGELCQAVNETVFDNGPTERKKGGYENMRREAVQVAAVAVAFVEYLDRCYHDETGPFSSKD